MIQVSPCPFCGHDDVEIDEVSISEFAVDCPECQAARFRAYLEKHWATLKAMWEPLTANVELTGAREPASKDQSRMFGRPG